MTNSELHILHLFNDEKFVDGNIRLMKKAGIPSDYVILTDRDSLRFVSDPNVTVLPYQSATCNELKKIIKDKGITHIGFHGLDRKGRFVDCLAQDASIRAKTKFIWFIFGYDLYNRWPPLRKNLYEPYTAALLGKNFKGLKKRILHLLESPLVFKIGIRIPFEKWLPPSRFKSFLENYFPRTYLSRVRQMDYAAPVLPIEMQYVKQIDPSLKYLPFTYQLTLEHTFPELPLQHSAPDHHIIIGNSNDSTNNHADVFHLLKNIPLHRRKIYVPLGYGSNMHYKEEIIRLGKSFFGKQFIPLTDFMPLDDYHRLLQNTHAAVYHHKRQQAIGNIIIMFYIGAKVFLHPESPTFDYFRSEGLHVFSSLEIDKDRLHTPLTPEMKQHNRREILRLYGKRAVLDRIKKFEQILREDMAVK